MCNLLRSKAGYVKMMGPLLDPNLYPMRVGVAPETLSSRYDQANSFLDRLQSQYPMLYNIIQGEPSSPLKQKVDRDRNKCNYQFDYRHHKTMQPIGKTEYQDGFSKLGGNIMRDSLHWK